MERISLRRWGNSLGIRIPRSFLRQAGMEEGTPLEIRLQGDSIVISKPKFELSSLLAGITNRNRHGELFDSKPAGKEAW